MQGLNGRVWDSVPALSAAIRSCRPSACQVGRGETQQAFVRTTGVGDNNNRSRYAVMVKMPKTATSVGLHGPRRGWMVGRGTESRQTAEGELVSGQGTRLGLCCEDPPGAHFHVLAKNRPSAFSTSRPKSKGEGLFEHGSTTAVLVEISVLIGQWVDRRMGSQVIGPELTPA